MLLLISIAAVSLAGFALLVALFRQFTRGDSFTVTPVDATGNRSAALVLSSVLGLFLELLLIRWISSEIRIFAYFKNFVLVACFLGFGLGFYLCRRAITATLLIAPLIYFVLLIQLPMEPLRLVIVALPSLLGATSDMQIWSVGPTGLTPRALWDLFLACVVTVPLFGLLATTFIPIGQFVGWLLETAPKGIAAYTVNVGASLLGIALYTSLCFANQPPAVWFAIAGVLTVALFWRVPRIRWISGAAFVACVLLLLIPNDPGWRVFWSPYQKLSLRPFAIGNDLAGYELNTNGSWYQRIANLSPQFIHAHPEVLGGEPVDLIAYNLPYRFGVNSPSVLVLGSGMGNDVAAALRNGATHVTAVEIDPLILRLGRALHPEHPYQSPRVTVVVDDARSYIENATEQYDLIVFSLLDSHTTTSHYSNIRIDNYVYTREALAAARKLLRPNGTFIVKFQANRPWIAGRLYELMTSVFGSEPLRLIFPEQWATAGQFFIGGSRTNIIAALHDPRLRAIATTSAQVAMQRVPLTTDDWPYFYQRMPGVPTSVIVISLLLLATSFAAVRSFGIHAQSLRFEFFFLGAGFLLLETQIVSRMALLFGTTWIVNAIVIAVLLLLIVVANVLVERWRTFPVPVAYAGVVAAILAGYVLPIHALFFRSFVLRATVSTLVLTFPVFFAGIVFIRRFAEAGFAGEALGSNLLGSLAGGIAESLSLYFGLRALLIAAALLYVAAWTLGRRSVRTSIIQAPA